MVTVVVRLVLNESCAGGGASTKGVCCNRLRALVVSVVLLLTEDEGLLWSSRESTNSGLAKRIIFCRRVRVGWQNGMFLSPSLPTKPYYAYRLSLF